MGGPLGQTKKVTEPGIEDVTNDMGAFMVVRAKFTRRPPDCSSSIRIHDLSGRVLEVMRVLPITGT